MQFIIHQPRDINGILTINTGTYHGNITDIMIQWMITLSLVYIKHPPLHGPKYVTIPLLKHGFLDFLVVFNILWGKKVSQLISGSKPINTTRNYMEVS